MRVYIDIVTLLPTSEIWDRSTIIQSCTAKNGDGGVLEIMYHRNGVPERLPEGAVLTYIVKTHNKFDQNPALCELQIASRPDTDAGFYIGEPDYNTDTLKTELASGDGNPNNDLPYILGDGEISYLLAEPGAKPKSSLTFPVTIHNDVKKGNEGLPSSGAPNYLTDAESDARYIHQDENGFVPIDQLPLADQAQAEAGIDNTHLSTPLRVWQAIAAWWAALSVPWAKLTGKPTTLTGYGITDAVPSSRTVSTGFGLTGGGDLTANRTLSLTGQALALFNLAANGLIARTGAGTVEARTIAPATTSITVTNGDGVAGNPTIGLASASTILRGGVVLASNAEVQAGTDSQKGIVSSALAAWWTNIKSLAQTISGLWTFTGRITAAAQISSTASPGMYGGADVVRLIAKSDNNDIAVLWDGSTATAGAATWSFGLQMNGSGFGGDGSMVLYNYADGNKRFKFGLDGNFAINSGGLSVAGNIVGNGTSNTLPNQTAATGAHIMTRGLTLESIMQFQPFITTGFALSSGSGDMLVSLNTNHWGSGVTMAQSPTTAATWGKAFASNFLSMYGENALTSLDRSFVLSWTGTVPLTSDSYFDVYLGGLGTETNGGALAGRGLRVTLGAGNITLAVHNGTNEANATVSSPVALNSIRRFFIKWDDVTETLSFWGAGYGGPMSQLASYQRSTAGQYCNGFGLVFVTRSTATSPGFYLIAQISNVQTYFTY